MSSLPTYDDARSQTYAVMQRMVDLAPTGEGFEHVDLRKDSPFACGDKDGVFFTGHWAVRTPRVHRNSTVAHPLGYTRASRS